LLSRTAFSAEDLTFLWDALKNMFEHDRSAARGEMAARKLVAFEHSCALGKAPAHELFERVVVEREHDGDVYPIGDKRLDNLPPARRSSDYRVTIDHEALPDGVTIHEWL
jgi:CRISPR-associated protein Csd2